MCGLFGSFGKIGSEPVRDGRRDTDEATPPIGCIRGAFKYPVVAHPLDQLHCAAHRNACCDTKRRHRQGLAFRLVDEQIEQNVPSRLSEMIRSAQQLLAQHSSPHRRLRIANCNRLRMIVVARRAAAERHRPGAKRLGRHFIVGDEVMRPGRGYDDMIEEFDA